MWIAMQPARGIDITSVSHTFDVYMIIATTTDTRICHKPQQHGHATTKQQQCTRSQILACRGSALWRIVQTGHHRTSHSKNP